MAIERVNEQWAQQRGQELEIWEQMEQRYAADRAEKQREQDERYAQIQAAKRARQAALERGEEPPPLPYVPSWDEIYRAPREAAEAERQRLEAERIAALSPRDVLISALPFQVQQRIATWEQRYPGREFPLEALNMR